jgi:molybdopterin/thiamine biosynthesis adenylyltransferase
MKIKVIGAGGIGTALLFPLGRYLNFLEGKHTVTVIDGDIYEEKNRERQTFDRLGRKAEVTAERLQADFPDVVFRAKAEYVTATSCEYLLEEGDIIFMGVDNHKTRKLVSDYCELMDNVVLISGGNDYTDGNIQVHIRQDGKCLTLPIANKFHMEITEPKDRSPDQIGCSEEVKSEPQLIFANLFIAVLMLNAFYAHLQKKLDYDEVYADVLTNSCRPVNRRTKR